MNRRRVITVLLVTAAHFVATICSIVLSFGAVMSGFDDPAQAVSPVTERLMIGISNTLTFPLMPLFSRVGTRSPAPIQHLMFLANSLLWASLLVWAGARLRSRWNASRARTTGSLPEG